MDPKHFDAITRTLGTESSRRMTLGLALGGLVGAFDLLSTDGKKRKRKRKKKKASSPPTSPPPNSPPPDPGLTCGAGQRPCRGSCLSTSICCVDAECAGGRTCQDGTCACPADKPHVCPDSTICQQCCHVDDCRPDGFPNDGQVCQDGTCRCTTAGTRRCPEGMCGECCSGDECGPGRWACTPHTNQHNVCHCSYGTCRDNFCLQIDDCHLGLCADECMIAGHTCCGSGKGRLVCQADVVDGQLRCLPPQE
jgi:hypothetical protein